MVLDRVADLVKDKSVFAQGVIDLFFRDHVPVGQAPPPALVIHDLVEAQHDDGVFPAFEFIRDGAVVRQDPAFLLFQIGFHPVHAVFLSPAQVLAHGEPGNLPDFRPVRLFPHKRGRGGVLDGKAFFRIHDQADGAHHGIALVQAGKMHGFILVIIGFKAARVVFGPFEPEFLDIDFMAHAKGVFEGVRIIDDAEPEPVILNAFINHRRWPCFELTMHYKSAT